MKRSKPSPRAMRLQLILAVTMAIFGYIQAWKERYGENKIKIASLPKDDDGNEFMDVIVRVPDRKCLGEFEKWVDKSPDKAKEILVNACVLSSKETVKADDGLFFAAFDAITKLIPVRTAIVKNC